MATTLMAHLNSPRPQDRDQARAWQKAIRAAVTARMEARFGPGTTAPKKHRKAAERPISWTVGDVVYTLGDGISPITPNPMGDEGGEYIVVFEVRGPASTAPLWERIVA